MAKKNTPTYPSFTTPAGEYLFPKLLDPDFKFNPEGLFSCTIILEPTPENVEFMATLEGEYEEQMAALKEEHGDHIKMADKPWGPEVDYETKVETDRFAIKTKMKHHIETKAGKSWTQSPKVFDTLGQPVRKDASIGSGSIGRLSFELVPYYTAMVGAGVTLRLKAAQVIEAKAFASRSAEDYGFPVEEVPTEA